MSRSHLYDTIGSTYTVTRRTDPRIASQVWGARGEARTVLKEMGLDLPPEVEIRVWDTTADTRYMVLPEQPPETIGWPMERLAEIVTRDSMIGVARL